MSPFEQLQTDLAVWGPGGRAGRYRYALYRPAPPELTLPGVMPGGRGPILWAMLNPSTATELEDDPTIRRCLAFSRRWGYEAVMIWNLFGYRTPKPDELWAAAASGLDVVGPENAEWLSILLAEASVVVAAWGDNGRREVARPQVRGFFNACEEHGIDMVWCLGETKFKEPVHPLFVPADREPSQLSVRLSIRCLEVRSGGGEASSQEGSGEGEAGAATE